MKVFNGGATSGIEGRDPPGCLDAPGKGVAKEDVGCDRDNGEVDGRGYWP